MSVDDICPQATGLRHLSIEALTALRDQVHAEIASRRGPLRPTWNVVPIKPGDRVRIADGNWPDGEPMGVLTVSHVLAGSTAIFATGDREDER